MYGYLQSFASRIGSFFEYVFCRFAGKRKKYKNNDDCDDVISYDDIYGNRETAMCVSLLEA